MAELTKNRVLLFVSLMIFPAYALDVILSSAHADFKQKSEINIEIRNGEKMYAGTLNELSYEAQIATSKVIVYIIGRSRLVEIIRNAVRGKRLQIAWELNKWHCELVFLGIENFDGDEYHVISAFMGDKIRSNPMSQTNCTIETIGEKHFDRFYHHSALDLVWNIRKYQENDHICGGSLVGRLRSIPHGALRSVESNNKEIKLYGFYPIAKEVKWSFIVVNNEYSPRVNVSDPTYNFRIRHPADKKICLLVLGAKDYATVTTHGRRMSQKAAMKEILDEMTKNNEVLIILGAFNFDWTDIDIVTQIILKHSEGWDPFGYNVFTCGYGMFNSAYTNEYGNDERRILAQPSSSVSEVIKVLMGAEVKERAIDLYYFDDGWRVSKEPINLCNGRYFPAEEFKNFTFPWVDEKIVFIVYDSTEMNKQIDLSTVFQSVEKLKSSGINVVMIKAINFGLDDTHIVAEWIDYRRGVIDAEQIAVLGGGILDTIFQSKKTTYNTLLNTKKRELKSIRNALVKSGNEKRVFAADIYDRSFKVWTYPMNTVNAFYEPDMIPDKNMFATTHKKRILFIITSAHIFHQSTTMIDARPVISMLRGNIKFYYSHSEWNVYLVGLDNFGERDHHLFAELVKRQTVDGRPLDGFVCTFNYGIGLPTYQYKETQPFPTDSRSRVQERIACFFGLACRHAQDNVSTND